MDTEDAAQLILGIVARPLLYTALVALAFAPLERLAPLRETSGPRPEVREDVLFATGGAVLAEALQYVVAGTLLWLSESVAEPIGLGALGPLRVLHPAVRIAVGLVLFELAGYGYHRLAHRWAPLWRLHAVHHSSGSMDWLASFRQHPLEIAMMTAAQNLPLVLLGMPLGSHVLVVLLLRLQTVFVHSNLRTPRWLGLVLATPAFHHRHHDREGGRSNFASLFPWIDRAFGTFDSAAGTDFGENAQGERGRVTSQTWRAPAT